jgi:hypothetical protein
VWLFVGLARSVYVSPESVKEIEVETVDLGLFLEHIANHSVVVALMSKASEMTTITCLLHAQALFPQADIVFMRPPAIKPWLANRTLPASPYFVVVERATVSAVIGPIDDDITALTALQLHLTRRPRLLDSVAALLGSLSAAPITLIGVEA